MLNKHLIMLDILINHSSLLLEFLDINGLYKFKNLNQNWFRQNVLNDFILKKKTINCFYKNLLMTKLDRDFPLPQLKKLYYSLPKLVWNDDFMGMTDYIDSIYEEDLPYPVMSGEDCYRRKFICVKYQTLDSTWEFDGNTYKNYQNKVYCLTIFQRYTSCRTWCKAGPIVTCRSAPLLYGSSVSLEDKTIKLFVANIYRFLENEPIYYYDYLNKSAQVPNIPKSLNCKLSK